MRLEEVNANRFHELFIEMSDMIGHMHELLRSTMILPVRFDGHAIFIDLTQNKDGVL